MGRNYKNYGIETSAEIIVSECIHFGKSTGWCGSLEDLESVSRICNAYNVRYVCDFTGTWRPVAPRQNQ